MWKGRIVLHRFFQRNKKSTGPGSRQTPVSNKKLTRHSSGWGKVLVRLQAQKGLRVLDIGPTSPNNINFLTGLGHSVFMSDLVEESNQPEWVRLSPDGAPETYDTAAFIQKRMDFGQRIFDVVLLWDALDYIPQPLVPDIVGRLHACMTDGGEILCLFHTRASQQKSVLYRYHITDGENVEMQEHAPYSLAHVYTNRAIEKLFAKFHACRFFLAKDNLCEVIIKR